jgi:hypothetical protein
MTEQEWLVSTDVAAMLAYLTARPQQPAATNRKRASDRKLRLFAAACSRAAGQDSRFLDRWGGGEPVPDEAAGEALMAARSWCEAGDPLGLTAPFRAALLRDVIGNPLRPAYWADDPKRHAEPIHFGAPKKPHPKDGPHVEMRRSWLTTDVLGIARSAYESRCRQRRECGRCHGSGIEQRVSYDDYETFACPGCRGTGSIEGGTLDPQRLAVLSDALEEAGCPAAQGRTVSQVLAVRREAMGACCNRYADQMACSCLQEAEPDGLLEHLRSVGPHVAGCWSLDLILGLG